MLGNWIKNNKQVSLGLENPFQGQGDSVFLRGESNAV